MDHTKPHAPKPPQPIHVVMVRAHWHIRALCPMASEYGITKSSPMPKNCNFWPSQKPTQIQRWKRGHGGQWDGQPSTQWTTRYGQPASTLAMEAWVGNVHQFGLKMAKNDRQFHKVATLAVAVALLHGQHLRGCHDVLPKGGVGVTHPAADSLVCSRVGWW